MAGDWIPVEIALTKKPEVLAIARQTGRSRHEVVGLLIEFWSWASVHSRDGALANLTALQLPEVAGGDPRFWAAVEAVGWLAADGSGLRIPNWDRWLSRSAKARALDRRLKAAARSGKDPPDPPDRPEDIRQMSGTEPDKNRTTEQNIRGKYPPETPSDCADLKEISFSDKGKQRSSVKENAVAFVIRSNDLAERWLKKMDWPEGLDDSYIRFLARLVEAGKIPEAIVASAVEGVRLMRPTNHGGYLRASVEDWFLRQGREPPAFLRPPLVEHRDFAKEKGGVDGRSLRWNPVRT